MSKEKCTFCRREGVDLYDFEVKNSVTVMICLQCAGSYFSDKCDEIGFDKLGMERVTVAFINNFWE